VTFRTPSHEDPALQRPVEEEEQKTAPVAPNSQPAELSTTDTRRIAEAVRLSKLSKAQADEAEERRRIEAEQLAEAVRQTKADEMEARRRYEVEQMAEALRQSKAEAEVRQRYVVADWQMAPATDGTGRFYYWNTKTRVTSWDHPSTFLGAAVEEDEVPAAKEWACPRCAFNNTSADVCEICQLARPESSDSSKAVSVPQIRIPPAQPDSSKPVAAASPKDDSALSPEDGDHDECVICMDKPRTHACIPCGHMLLCDGKGEDCQPHSVTMKQGCPLCNEAVTSITKIYSR